MARKHQLRGQRAGTVINFTSKRQEPDGIKALAQVVDHLVEKFGKTITLVHEKQWPSLATPARSSQNAA